MSNSFSLLDQLIQDAYSGPVFGPDNSFGSHASTKLPVVKNQIESIAIIFNQRLYAYIKTSQPDLDDPAIKRLLQEIGPKAICFCPALTISELDGKDNTERLAAAATAIGVMYLADQSMDRGNEHVTLAIKQLAGEHSSVPTENASSVESWFKTLHFIEENINLLGMSEDTPIVLDCFNEQVLHNEVRLHELSMSYKDLPLNEQPVFLENNTEAITKPMVISAGFPSVTSSLYAIYHHNDPSLPSLSNVHTNPHIAKLIEVCNTVVRIADEFGDWETDAGHHPEWGVFSINPFNQYHPEIIRGLCSYADIQNSELIEALQSAFKAFHLSSEIREKNGKFIVDTFFNQAKICINNLPEDTAKTYSLYITLCKRVLEIGSVNIIGDIALADV